MALSTQINNLATAIGGKVKDLYNKCASMLASIGTLANLTTTAKSDLVSAINENVGKISTNSTNIGTLANLTTTAKGDIVSALNEVNAKPTSAGGPAINDSAPSTTSVYSSQHVEDVTTAKVNAVLGGADAAYNTLLKIENAVKNDDSGIATLTTAIGTAIHYDAAQSLTTAQQQQACANAGVGDPTTDFVATFNAALA